MIFLGKSHVTGMMESVDNLAAQYNEMGAGFNQFVLEVNEVLGKYGGLMNNLDNIVGNHNVRMNVLEILFSHPDFAEERERFIYEPVVKLLEYLGVLPEELDLESSEQPKPLELAGDLTRIAKEHVVPLLRAQHEEAMQRAREARGTNRFQGNDAAANDFEPESKGETQGEGAQIVDFAGHPARPQTMMDEEDD